MELKIYDKQGIVKMTVSPDNSSQWNHEVGVENVVTVNFTTWEFLVLEVGWYILVEGQRFSIKSEYRPKHIHDTKYTYNLKFYGREHDAQDILFCRLNQGEDDLESVFAYDGTPMDFLQKVVSNMNRNTEGVVWKAGEAISVNRKTINFNGLYCWDALNEISRTFGTEWWMDGEYLNISKCERGESVSLGYGQGLKSGLTQNENTNAVKWFTRLIPVGSSKNIDKSKYGYDTLQLPGREKYIDINTQYGLKEYREEAAFSEIYPHRVGTISSVRSEAKIDDQGEEYLIYYVKDTELPFNPDNYMLPGEVIHMSFNSGNLAGKEFEVNWNNSTEEFEIINQYPEYVDQLPGGNLIPSSGDQYVLSNISMPDEYNTIAEEAYQSAVDKYIQEYDIDISIYSGVTDYIYISKNNISLSLGKRVNLISKRYFDSGNRGSRITRISRKLNNLSEMTLECSNTISSTWKQALDSSINNTIVNQQKTQVKTDKNEKDISQISGLWELKKTEDGVEYLYTKFNVLTALGFTAYSIGKEKHFPSIYDGLLIDNDTIYWEEIKDEEGNVISKRLKARGGSGEEGITPTLLGDLSNVGSWANDIAKSDRVLFQQNGTTSWVGLSTEYLVKKYAYTKAEADRFLENKWTKNDELIGQWNTAYKWGNHAGQGYLKEGDISGKYLKLAGGTMTEGSSIISGFIYPLENNKYALGLLNRAYGYVYSHRYFVDNLEIKKSQDDVIFIDANLVVRGGITMYGTDGTAASSIWDGAPKATTSNTTNGKGVASFDSKFFSVNDGHVTFIGTTGGGGLDENALANYLNANKYLTETTGNSLYLGIKAKAESASTADSATNATNASNIYLNSASSNSTYRLVLANNASGENRSLYVDSESTATAGYNPSTNTFIGNGFSGNSVTLGNGVSAAINTKGWYRFATTINAENVAGGSLIFSIRRQYNTSKTESHTIVASLGYGAVTFTEIAGAPSDALITKVRATNNKDGVVYFDFYYGADTSKAHNVHVNCIGSATLQTPTATTQVLGYLTEFDLVNGFKSNVLHFTSLNNLGYIRNKCGKNLLVGGDNLSGGTAYAFAGYNYDSAVTVGRTYRLTICGKLGENTSHIYAYWDGGGGNNTYIGGLSKTEERIVTIRAKITNKGGNNRLIFYKFNSSNTQETTSYAYIRWAYLEEEFQEGELRTTSDYDTWLAEYNKRDTKTFLHKIYRIDLDGLIKISRPDGTGDAFITCARTDTNKSIAFGVGIGGVNRGIWDYAFNKWLFYANADKTWLTQNTWISQDTWNGGLILNRRSSDGGSGCGISVYAENTTKGTITELGQFGIAGNGRFEFDTGSGNTRFYVDTSGNGLFYGGITMYSDERKKTILNHVELTLKQVADAPIIEHYYNYDEKKTTHVGSIAQYWAGLNDWFCKEDGDGFYTMEIQNAALASAISVARELVKYESKTDKQIRLLKKRICELEDEIETLKGK